jgi:hypothetical protein
MTTRDIARFEDFKREERAKIDNGMIEPRELIEAGGQFDYLSRKADRKGFDFRAEW